MIGVLGERSYDAVSVLLQVSPIEFGHILLVPRVMDHIPQRIDPDTFLLALHMIAEVNNPYFRVGYNSLGAFATINQLHFQVNRGLDFHASIRLFSVSLFGLAYTIASTRLTNILYFRISVSPYF